MVKEEGCTRSIVRTQVEPWLRQESTRELEPEPELELAALTSQSLCPWVRTKADLCLLAVPQLLQVVQPVAPSVVDVNTLAGSNTQPIVGTMSAAASSSAAAAAAH